MKNVKTDACIRAKANVKVSDASREISKASIMTLGAMSLAIGVWGVASFVSALVTLGPIELISSFWTALGL